MFTAQKIITQFVQDRVDEIVKHVRVKYDSPDFDVNVKLSFANGVGTSRGGLKYTSGPFIKLACSRYIYPCENPETLINENEYDHYKNDPIIGELKNVHWTQALALLVAHEVGHAIQYHRGTKEAAAEQFGIKNLDRRNSIFQKHDWFFQRIYADLRQQFVNDRTFTIPHISTPVAPKTKKGWTSKEHNTGGGRFAYYFKDDGSLIGCLFNRWKQQIYVYNTETKQYTPTGLYDVREARRKIFNI